MGVRVGVDGQLLLADEPCDLCRPLEPGPQPGLDSFGGKGGVLYCEECGCCSGELGKSWVAYMCNDADGIDEPRIVVYCPPCAAAEFWLPTRPRSQLRLRVGTAPQPNARSLDGRTVRSHRPHAPANGAGTTPTPATLERASNRGSSKVETTDRRARRTASVPLDGRFRQPAAHAATRAGLRWSGVPRGRPRALVSSGSRGATPGDGDTRAGSRGTQARGGRDPKRCNDPRL